MQLFRKNERLARRYGPKLLAVSINAFLLILTVVFFVNLAEIAMILGWIPDLDQLSRRFE